MRGEGPSLDRSSFLPDFGVFLESWVSRGRLMTVAGDVGKFGLAGNLGHAHDDCLSYCVYVDGAEVVSDPGVFRYADDESSLWFKQVGAHNVVRSPSLSHASLARFFRWRNLPRDERVSVGGSGDAGRLSFSRRVRLKRGFLQQHRRWILGEEGLSVEDRVQVGPSGGAVNRVNFGPGVHLRLDGDDSWIGVLRGESLFRVIFRSEQPASVELVPSRHAPIYGEVQETQALEWTLPADLKVWRFQVSFELF